MTFSRPRRWSDLSRVERVDVYTRQSLSLVLWGFCAFVLLPVLPETSSSASATTLICGGVVVTAVGSSVMAVVVRNYPAMHPPWRRVAVLVVAGCGYLAAGALSGEDAVRGAAAVIVAANLAMALGGLADNRVSLALIATSGAVVGLVGGKPASFAIGLGLAVALVFSVRVSLWLYGIVSELDDSRHAQAQLAVAQERLRFSNDVHDVLGRRLSTIAVQSELAATSAERGDARAAARMLEVRGVAHQALTEARELARGYRPIDLTRELDGARSLLRSAGIDARLDVDVVPRAWHEAAGWVVRESVTNVLRHSNAQLVNISYDDGELRIDNDGLPPDSSDTTDASPDGSGGGSGLRALGERLAPLGAALVARRHGEHWTVLASLPGTGPISATRSADPLDHTSHADDVRADGPGRERPS